MMRHVADALRCDDTTCRPADLVHGAGEIWFDWGRLSKGETQDLTAEFERHTRVLDQATTAYIGGEC